MSSPVVIDLDRGAGLTRNGQLALFTAVNLLSRLHPVVTSVRVEIEYDAPVLVPAPLFSGDSVASAIRSFAGSLGSPTELTVASTPSRSPEPDFVMSAGGFRAGTTQLSFGSEGWNAFLSTATAMSFSETFNPIGCMAAACLAASEAFKHVMAMKARALGIADELMPAMQFLEGDCSFSTLTYQHVDGQTPNPALPAAVNVGDLTVIGVGAGGGACLYALSLLKLSGQLWMVDPDVINPHNLNRYIYAVWRDAAGRRNKVEVFREILRNQGTLQLHAHAMPFLEFKRGHTEWPKDLVLSTVDGAEVRHTIQWELPRLVLDAAVSLSSFYVHRVALGKSACLKCTHSTEDQNGGPLQTIASMLELDPEEAGRLYFDNIPLDSGQASGLTAKAAAHGLPGPEAGMTLRDWTTLHCGQLDLTGAVDLVLPIPFATVLPGILLAGEVIKEQHFPEYTLRDRVNHDTFSQPSRWLQTPLFPKPACPLCGDESVRRSYESRYHGDR